MSNLRDLILSTPIRGSFKQQQLAVFNGREGTTAQDGGRCCCWLIPSGTTWATFEMWGAGGDGGGACCCMGPYRNPGTGQYAKKTVPVNSANTFFIICAAGSGCCSLQCCGGCGFPSFVLCCTLGVSVCAGGGSGGCTVCHRMGGQACTGICVPGSFCGGTGTCNGGGYDLALPSVSNGDMQNNFCTSAAMSYTQTALKYAPNMRHSADSCGVGMTSAGCNYYHGQMTAFPGGPGASGQACAGACCWGGWGTGGLVLITYG